MESKLETLTSAGDGGRKRGGKKDDTKKNDKEVSPTLNNAFKLL
jgi:hypothetical protein